jgi:hypothetical protein
MAMDFLAGEPVKDLQALGKKSDDEAMEKAKGFEVGYDLFSITGTFGAGAFLSGEDRKTTFRPA